MFQIENFFAPSIGPPGLSIFVEAGVTLVGGSGVMVSATTVSLPANSTSFVYLNISTAVISHTTAGFPATNCYPIATVVTGTTGVVSLVDNRPDVTALSGSAVGTVTSVGTAGIATGGPITTTGTVTVAGSGNTTTAATANANLGAAPNGDVVTTDGSGNVKDSGTLLSSLAPLASPTFTGIATAPVFNATTGFTISGAAASGQFLRGNGTDFVSSAIQAGDLPAGTGTVTSFSAGNIDAIATTSVATPTTTPALTFALSTQTANTVWAGPTTGAAATPTFRALVAADLPAGTGTVTSFSAGNLAPLFTTSVATATTTPALSFALSNAAGGTVFGKNTTSAGAPAYTIAPVLGIPGTSTGTIALASSTASGLYTVTAPANAATPTLTLPTTSNVLAGQLAGDGTIFAATLVPASAAGTLTLPTPQTQTANTILAGPTTGAAAAPTFRALVAADIPSGTIVWNNIGNATGNLALANGTNTTTFNQTNNTVWQWANTTVATSSSTNATPQIQIAANYWTGAASAQDTWTISSSLAAGTNARSNLVIAHAGSSQTPVISFPNSSLTIVGFTASGQIGGGRAGLASSPAVLFTGAPFSGGSGTTTQPFFYFNSGASAPTTFNTGGTVIGINAVSGFAGNFEDYRINGGASAWSIASTGTINNYNTTATVRNGIPAEYASSDLTAQSAAITATTLLSAPRTGMYEVSWSADITTAASTSSVLGGTSGFQVIYTSPTDSVVKTTVAGNSTTSAANTTGTAVGGCISIFAKAATNIQFSYDYTSVGVTAMQFQLHITLKGL